MVYPIPYVQMAFGHVFTQKLRAPSPLIEDHSLTEQTLRRSAPYVSTTIGERHVVVFNGGIQRQAETLQQFQLLYISGSSAVFSSFFFLQCLTSNGFLPMKNVVNIVLLFGILYFPGRSQESSKSHLLFNLFAAPTLLNPGEGWSIAKIGLFLSSII